MSKTAEKKTTKTATKKNVKAEASVTAPVNDMPTPVLQGEEGGKKKRYFKCIVDGQEHGTGRYSGDKPKQAANKAFTNIVRTMLAKAKEEKKELNVVGLKVRFQMIECTRGRSHKVSSYEGERTKLDSPLKIEIKKATDKPKTIEYKYQNKIRKVRDAQAGGNKKKVAKKAKNTKKTTKAVAPPAETPKVEAKAEVKAETKTETKKTGSKKPKATDVKA